MDFLSNINRYTTKHHTHNHVAMIFQGRKLIAIGQNKPLQCNKQRPTFQNSAELYWLLFV